jgi:NAD(P)-dependent dehydrogenase (short-subunit alcohol dehydrogenase family)
LGTKKVVVLGGGGVVGRTAVKDLARSGVFSEVVVADREVEGAEREFLPSERRGIYDQLYQEFKSLQGTLSEFFERLNS